VRRFATLLALLGCLLSCGDAHSPAPTNPAMSAALAGASPETLWGRQCVACHGSAGEGNRALGAPALTQLSSAYIDRQLSHFVNGVRGAHPDDAAGKRMALSVANLTPEDIAGLAGYLSTELAGTRPIASLTGNAARGQDYYSNLCSACHGGNALGNDLLGAPALAGVSDWYLLSAYQSFLDGLRGQHPDDTYGAQMARLAAAVPDSDDLRDVIAFINTLPPQRP
jgi:cytochrome c oxidase subunit 2